MSYITDFLRTKGAEAYYHYDTHIAPLPRDEKGNIIARDNAVDAFRHAYTAAMLTHELSDYVGTELASVIVLSFGLANEVEIDLNADQSKNMDIWNNAIGSNLAKLYSDKGDLLYHLENSFKSGDMILSINDDRVFGQDFKDIDFKVRGTYFLTPPDIGNIPRDPLILDLNGDGVQLTNVIGSNAYFDLDNDGIREQVGWMSPNDGLLVRDLNGNGVIDNLGELIGTEELNAYAIMSGFDDNNDDVIDNQDTVWSSLKVWQDSNSNGVTDVGELQSLAYHKLLHRFFAIVPSFLNQKMKSTHISLVVPPTKERYKTLCQ